MPADVEALLAAANELKASGNEAFKAGELGKATSAYQEAVDKLTSEAGKKLLREWWDVQTKLLLGGDAKDSVSPLLASPLHTNLAACHVKLSQWKSAVHAATAALDTDGTSVKARFRRGVANSHLGLLEEAKADLTQVGAQHSRAEQSRAEHSTYSTHRPETRCKKPLRPAPWPRRSENCATATPRQSFVAPPA